MGEKQTKEQLKGKLTPKELLFCHEYIVDWNGARSARDAGYSHHTAAEQAYEILRKPHVKEYIDLIKDDLAAEAGISKLRIIKELSKIAFANITDVLDIETDMATGNILGVRMKDDLCLSEMPLDVSATISEASEGKEGIKIKQYCKDAALAQLAKLMGWNAPEKIVSEVTTVSDIDYSKLSAGALEEILALRKDKEE